MHEAFAGASARRLTARDVYEQHYKLWAPELAARTARRYRHELTRWEELTGNVPLTEVTTSTYQRFRSESSKRGHAACTTETTLQFIRSLIRCAHAFGLVAVVPDRGRARRVEPPQPNPPTVEEIDALMRHTGVARWPRLHVPPKVFWRSWMAVGFWTALRREDLTWNLKYEHVNFDEHRILFTASKTRTPHPFPLNPIVERHIREMQPAFAVPPSRPIFGPSRSPHLMQRELDRIADAARIRRVTPKSFRQASINAWTMADPRAGEIIHGCGIPRVLSHYLDRLQLLKHAAEKIVVPTAMTEFHDGRRQGTLFS